MRLPLVIFLSVVFGCGSSTPTAEAPRSAASSSAPAQASATQAEASAAPTPGSSKASPLAATSDDSAAMPTTCADSSQNPCTMNLAFVKRLCSRINPDIAIALFAKETPWLRVYVNVRQADSFNGQGGPSSEQKLTFDEELLVLAERKADLGGMSVSGAGSTYDVLRWDGSCATLSVQETTTRKPPRAKHATIPWRILSEPVQSALLKDEKIAGLAAERRKQCKGVTIGTVSLACEKADRGLNDRIPEALRAGLPMPMPARLP